MPNHVTNVLHFKGNDDDIEKMLDEIKNDACGRGTISFDKIIPMPKDVFRGNLGTFEREKYGENNWYDWSIKNWGTKWEAYDFLENNSSLDEMEFYTAWSAPHPVIEKLAGQYPNIEINHLWADEDIGYNCGEREYIGGELVSEYFPNEGKEVIEFSAKVQGIDLDDLNIDFEETGGMTL